jgi:hypothetical protein
MEMFNASNFLHGKTSELLTLVKKNEKFSDRGFNIFGMQENLLHSDASYSFEERLEYLKYLISSPKIDESKVKRILAFCYPIGYGIIYDISKGMYEEIIKLAPNAKYVETNKERVFELLLAYTIYIRMGMHDFVLDPSSFHPKFSEDKAEYNDIMVGLINILLTYLELAIFENCPIELLDLFEDAVSYENENLKRFLGIKKLPHTKDSSVEIWYYHQEIDKATVRIDKMIDTKNPDDIKWVLNVNETLNDAVSDYTVQAKIFSDLRYKLGERLDKVVQNVEKVKENTRFLFNFTDPMQKIMDRVEVMSENSDKDLNLPENIEAVVAFLNLSYQVMNGGFTQYFQNDYYKNMYRVFYLLALVNTEATKEAIKVLKDVRDIYYTILIHRNLKSEDIPEKKMIRIEGYLMPSNKTNEDYFNEIDIEHHLLCSLRPFDTQWYEIGALEKDINRYIKTNRKDFIF